MSYKQKKTKTRPVENVARREIDYVNVQFARKVGGKRFLASIGENQRVTPELVTESNRFALSSSTDSVDGPTEGKVRKEYRQKVKIPKNKPKKQYRASAIDSDSSSIEGLSESPEILEAKAREQEHYNKLKLNLNRLAESKNVRKGVSVLYANAITGEIRTTRLASMSRVVRPHAPIQIPSAIAHTQAAPSSVAGEPKTAFLRVKKEGHVNRVHSVSGRSEHRSRYLLWKRPAIPKSLSMGDVHCIMEDEVNEEDRPTTRRTQSFSESSQTSVRRKLAEAAAKKAEGKQVPRRRYENVAPTTENGSVSYTTLQLSETDSSIDHTQRQRIGSHSERASVKRKDEHNRQRHSVLRNSLSQSTELNSPRLVTPNTNSKGFSYSYDGVSPSIQSSPSRHINQQLSPSRHIDQHSSPSRHIDQQLSPSRHIDQHSSPSRYIAQHSPPSRHIDQHSPPSRHIDQHSSPSRHIDQQLSPSRHMDQQLSPLRHLSPSRNVDQKFGRLSPQSRPDEMKTAPLSPLLRPATTHNSDCPITCTCHGIHFIDSIVSIPCDSNGGEYVSEVHDLKIVVPKGAIKKRTTVEIQIGVTMQGPFQFPQNTRAVSPIIWLGVHPGTKLKKPIEITLPHFLDSSSLNKNQVFLRASDKMSHNTSRAKYSTKKYSFKQVSESEGIFRERESHGILLTKQLSFFCIGANEESGLSVNCCLIPVIPRSIQHHSWKIHYCVTYLLKTCIQLVHNQFGTEWEVLPVRKFKFPGESEEAIEIQFERQLVEAGWILTLESNNRIHGSDIDLWGGRERHVDLTEPTSTYPPSFTIRVHGEDARMSSVALFKFGGVSEDITSEIALPLRVGHRASEQTYTPLSTPTSSVFSPQHISNGSSQESNFMSTPVTSTAPPHVTKNAWQYHSPNCTCEDCTGADYDHLPSMEELGQTHVQLTYHNGHIDLPTDEDLLNVATKVTDCVQEDWPILQGCLGIPDHIMLDVLNQRTIRLQVYRLLKEWRNHAKDCSKDKLANCLANADKRLETVSNDLRSVSK